MGRQMRLSGHSRAWRAVILACGILWFGTADLRAETPGSSDAQDFVQKSAEPFGLAASALSDGGLRQKWLGVQRRLDDEMVQLALCEGDRDGCVSPAALQFPAIIDPPKPPQARPPPAQFIPPPNP